MDVDTDYPYSYLQQWLVVKWKILNCWYWYQRDYFKQLLQYMGFLNNFIYLISAWSSLPYHENYTDQYVKTMQSGDFSLL